MKNSSPHYFVGIDLGTTHTVVAYVKTDQSPQDIKIFEIEQLVAPGEVAARPLLPSVRYHPAEAEISAADVVFTLPDETAIIGEAARVLGAKTQGRLVTSAKSWLSHPSVDASADILPWGSHDQVVKVSPLTASASYLAHIRTVWRHRFADAPLEQQDIVITVPASFDEAARSLTLAAAKLAGLTQVRLLEEPQAVCYDWLRCNAGQIQQALNGVHLLLVCDVGGGTTDLTLIKVEPGADEPKLTRIGVGDHLMLGGDNIDLALAHLVENRLEGEHKRLSAADLAYLIEQCRVVKEQLLSDDAPEQARVTLLGGGSKLIGSSRSVALTRDEVRKLALDGFFPLSGLDELPDRKRSGVVEFGLPYAPEPAISKHIAGFLKLYQQAASDALNGLGRVPDALLLNGGVFGSKPITERLVAVLNNWKHAEIEVSPDQALTRLVLLENKHPELSVALGAVSYALARRDKKVKIGGGAARSYFLLVETDDQNASQQGICILPRGSEEGEEVVLKSRQFSLRLGMPVRFHLVSLSGDTQYQAGDLAVINDELFHSLPPLAVAFDQDRSIANQQVIVELAVTQTEIGTLKIQCVAVEDRLQRWDVEFQIRKTAAGQTVSAELPQQFNAAVEKIQLVFGSRSKEVNPSAVKNLRAELEKTLAMPRPEWPVPLLRALFTVLLEGIKYRRRSEHHERVWLSLTGYCLRPGLGYPLDDWRVEQLWKVYPQAIQFVNETQNWTEWWTLWRRVSGGLNAEAQQQLFSELSKYINPASARQPGVMKHLKTRSYDEMVRLAAVLEHLPVTDKIRLVNWLLQRLQKSGESVHTWWAVGRIAARVPGYGSSHNVIAVVAVTEWLTHLLEVDWKKIPQAGFAATLMARMSNDRARDIDASLRARVVEKLKLSKAPNSWVEMVEVYRDLDEAEEKQMFGEALPPGLKLLG